MIIYMDGNQRIEIDEGIKIIENINTIKLLSPDRHRIEEFFLNRFLKEGLRDVDNYVKYMKKDMFKIDNLLDMFEYLKDDIIIYEVKEYIKPELKGDDLKYSTVNGNDHDSTVRKIIDWRGYWAFAGDGHEFRYYKDDVLYYLVLCL